MPVGLEMDTKIFQNEVKIKGATYRIWQVFLLPSVAQKNAILAIQFQTGKEK